jgi:hypothetical protein
MAAPPIALKISYGAIAFAGQPVANRADFLLAADVMVLPALHQTVLAVFLGLNARVAFALVKI